MESKSLSLGFSSPYRRLSNRNPLSHRSVSTGNSLSWDQRVGLGNASKLCISPNFKTALKCSSSLSLNRGITTCVSTSGTLSDPSLLERGDSSDLGELGGRIDDGVEAFHGKSGAVSFHGLTHQMVEEGKLISAPFPDDKRSFLWVLAPVALISSLVLPQFFLGNIIEAFVKDEALLEIAVSLSFDAVFYAGLMIFLLVTDRIQRPYLQFSTKRWSLITGLKGYYLSNLVSSSLKVVVPLLIANVTFPILKFSAFAAVAPFLIGCAVQYAFEKILERRQSSCWPLLPIFFEIYRLYQLTKATHFIQSLMFAMKDTTASAASHGMVQRGSALVAIVMTFQVLGLNCLWSLVTFLMRLFPSRPVASHY